MMHWLRHATGRLWLTLLVGVGSSLALMTVLQPAIGVEGAPVAAVAWMLLVFFVVGWGCNRLGVWQVRRLLQAADRAEREPLSHTAEALYRRGLAVLDSFLISPAVRRRSLRVLCARLARFYLARPGGGPSEAFIACYLAEVPGDEEVAEQWVLDLAGRDGFSEEHQGLLARLAAAHPDRDTIQQTLASVYVMQERTDFQALQCYRRVCGDKGPAPSEVCRRVAALLRQAGRSDDWARQLAHRFLEAAPAAAEPASAPSARDFRSKGVQAQVRHPATMASSPNGVDDDGAFRMSAALDDADDEETEEHPAPLGVGADLAAFWRRVTELAADVRAAAAIGLRRAVRGAAASRVLTWGRVAAVGLGAIVAAGGVWLWVGGADLFRDPAEPPAPVAANTASAPMVTDPFTLQVAAYLKAEYAHKFVENLKSQGLDAYWTETASGGKTWYQVRIAHFPDRSSAREFGNRLKQKGVIEDFYVTNYSR